MRKPENFMRWPWDTVPSSFEEPLSLFAIMSSPEQLRCIAINTNSRRLRLNRRLPDA